MLTFFYDKCTAVKRDCMTLSYCGQLFSHSACSPAVSTGLCGCCWSGEEAFIVRFLPSWAQRQLAAKFDLYVYKKSGYTCSNAVVPNWNLEGKKFVCNDSVNYDIVFLAFLAYVFIASFLRLSTLLKCAASLQQQQCCQAKTGPWGRHGWTLIGAWQSNVVC